MLLLVYTCCTVVQSVFITSGSADTVKTRLHAGTLKDRHEQPQSGGVPATIYSGVFEGMEYSSLEEY